MSDARDELLSLPKSDELRDAVLLVYGNKQDMPGAMSPAELTDKLGLHELYHRDWYVQGACATRGEGLNEGMSSLVNPQLIQFCRLAMDDEGFEETVLVEVEGLLFRLRTWCDNLVPFAHQSLQLWNLSFPVATRWPTMMRRSSMLLSQELLSETPPRKKSTV